MNFLQDWLVGALQSRGACPLLIVEDKRYSFAGEAFVHQLLHWVQGALQGRRCESMTVRVTGRKKLQHMLQTFRSRSSSEDVTVSCHVLESLTSLLLRKPVCEVLRVLDTEATAVCCVGLLHVDLLAHHKVYAVEQLAACVLRLQSCVTDVNGQTMFAIKLLLKCQSGRFHTWQQVFAFGADGEVKIRSCHEGRNGSLLNHHDGIGEGSGMRITLGTQEMISRQGTLLPHEATLDTKLCVVAKNASALGHIIYERDSGDEIDSDEDPDDDLDV